MQNLKMSIKPVFDSKINRRQVAVKIWDKCLKHYFSEKIVLLLCLNNCRICCL